MKKLSIRAACGAFLLSVGLVMVPVTSMGGDGHTISECQIKIESLKYAVGEADFYGRNSNKDEVGLTGKLDEALKKIDEAKFCDADGKLADFEYKVGTLILQGKIDSGAGEGLLDGVAGARHCVQYFSGDCDSGTGGGGPGNGKGKGPK